jgi:hypothetical protein
LFGGKKVDNWKSMLNADPIKWLLEDNNQNRKMGGIGKTHKTFILSNIKGRFGRLLSLLNLAQRKKMSALGRLANLSSKTHKIVKVAVFLCGLVPGQEEVDLLELYLA